MNINAKLSISKTFIECPPAPAGGVDLGEPFPWEMEKGAGEA